MRMCVLCARVSMCVCVCVCNDFSIVFMCVLDIYVYVCMHLCIQACRNKYSVLFVKPLSRRHQLSALIIFSVHTLSHYTKCILL